MKKFVHLLIAEIAAIAVLGAALAFFLLNPKTAEDTSYIVSARSATEIVSVNIQNEVGTIAVNAQGGGFVIEGIPSELVDIEGFIGLLTACSEVSALQKVENDNDAAAFGLDPQQASVNVVFADGEEFTLLLGNQEPLSGNYYFSVEGEEGIYLLEGETAEKYLMPKEALCSFYVTPKLAVSSALSAVRDVVFSGGELETPIKIESVSDGDEEVKELARSFGSATHIVRGAGVYELDQSYGLEMLTPLCGMMGQTIVYYGLTDEQVDSMGFAEPYMQAEFNYKNGTEAAEHYVLRFLPATEDYSFFYVNAKGSGVVYIIERLPFFDIQYDKLLLRWFVSPLLMDVSGITVDAGSKTYDFTIDQTDVKNPVVKLNGEDVDITLFRKLFQLLNSAASDGDYLGVMENPSGTPVMKVTYHYTEGKADDVIAMYPGESRRVNVYVNGVCEFAMRDAFVERAGQALAAIGRGEEFDINW